MHKMYISKLPILFSVRSFLYSLYGKCGKYVNKIISLILSLVSVFVFSFSCCAADDGEIPITDFTVHGYESFSSVTDDGVSNEFQTEASITTSNVSSGKFKGFRAYSFPKSTSSYKKVEVTLKLDDNFTITKGHEYNLKFSWGYDINLAASCRVYLHFFDNDGISIKRQELILQNKTQNSTIFYVDVNFTPNIDFEQAYKCVLRFEFTQNGYNSGSQTFYVSPVIELVDKDDDTGLIKSIIEAIKEIPEKIKGFFVELGDKIINGIKDLFIPDEEYLQNKKVELETFCVDHFGAVYQSIDVFIDFLNSLVSISPTEPKITFPAIDVPVLGKTYHLSDEVNYSFSWVNDSSHFLYYFYNFYRGFVTVILFLGFVNYCRNKYAEVFGGDKD